MMKRFFFFTGCALPLFVLLACAEDWTISGDALPDAIPDHADGPDWSDAADIAAEDIAADSGCPGGLTDCGGSCVNIATDHGNCGSCGNECDAEQVCSGGECLFECPLGTVACSGSCVDLGSDILNCGACGNVCEAGDRAEPVCEAGVCSTLCEEGWSDLDGDGSCETNCVPSSDVETCNGVDDNCDGAVDEGFDCRMGREVGCTTVCGSAGTGLCSLECHIPSPDHCTPPDEICNGSDDDCDGECDNGFDCCSGEPGSCTASCGTPGTRVCTATCMWSSCLAPDETCNGLDDDCDGECDNGFDCCMGASGSCSTSCGSTGSQTCSSGCSWSACDPPDETCNGEDDDCDGACDNGFECCRGATSSCTAGCGSIGSQSCSSSCVWGSCVPPSETCNGEDDNCDTICDNGGGMSCCRNESGPCTTSCGSTGSRTCSSSCNWGECSVPSETCNGSDDDCDGTPDNTSGCRIAVYRFLCDNDHFYKNDTSVPGGCVREGGVAWYMYATQVAGTSFSTTPLFMLYRAAINDHFYTVSEAERDSAISSGYVLEGNIGYCSTAGVPGMTTHLYRLNNGDSNDHFYTTSAAERDYAVSVGYTYEGVACNVWGAP